MIISQTPLRVSFFGGGTDLKKFYGNYGGVVLSGTIDKYIYIIVNSRNDDDIVLNYFERERVSNVDDIKHNIIREALKLTGLTKSIEITSISDIHEQGSGLGSSSAFTVGLLNALYAFKGEIKNHSELAKLACKIEIDILKEPIGKQDQYASAFGGFKVYKFNEDETVEIHNVDISQETIKKINLCSLMFNTGITRKASSVLTDQKSKIDNNIDNLIELKKLALQGEEYITQSDLESIGKMLDTNWEKKKKLSNRINNKEIDDIYNIAKRCGIYGGKLLGAGGGGYFLFICPEDKQHYLRESLKEYEEMTFAFEKGGSRIIFNDGKNSI